MTAAHCPICASDLLEEVVEVNEAPALVGTLWRTRDEALAAPVGTIRLTLCLNCGFIFNRAFSPRDLVYTPDFDIELHHSPTYQSYLEAEAAQLIERYGIRHGTVVEVGCGSGHVLRLFCSLGENTGYGFDPSLAESRVEHIGDVTVTLVNEIFDSSSDVPAADLVLSRSVLESIADPVTFLTSIREAIGDSSHSVLYLEVPNATWVFTRQRAWNFYYEHCSYFTVDLLPRLLRACGFDTLVCEPCYDDGQHLRVEARPGASSRADLATRTDELAEIMQKYRRGYKREVEEWRERVVSLSAQGNRVGIWGAGGRGITFLNTLFEDPAMSLERIPFAVDINPSRQGKFLPRTGQQVLAPAALRTEEVDVLIITNATYASEIRAEVRELGLECALLVV
jgi:hypothetical protein